MKMYDLLTQNRRILTIVMLAIVASAGTNAAMGAAVPSQACQQLMNMCESAAHSCYKGPYTPFSCYYYTYDAECVAAVYSCDAQYVIAAGKVVSILYMPPGDKSSVAYSQTASTGTTDSLSVSSSYGTTVSLSGTIKSTYGDTTISGSVGITNTSSTSNTATTTITNTQGTQYFTSGNPIDHTKDVLTIWVNPQLTVTQFPVSGMYIPGFGGDVFGSSLGNAAYNQTTETPIFADAIATGDMSLISVTVTQLQNPTQLAPAFLVSQTLGDGNTVPGLLSLCKSPMPESQCTLAQAKANGCGCTAADFSALVQQDPFFNLGIANPSVDAINAVDPNGARFVPVADINGADMELPLQPGITQTMSITDANNSSVTYTNTVDTKITAKIGYSYSDTGFSTLDSTEIDLMSTESVGHTGTNSTAHTQSLTLATSSANCVDYVNVYEDTVFHTFLFTNASNAVDPCE